MIRVSFMGSKPDLHVALDEGASVQTLLDQVRCLPPAPPFVAYSRGIFPCELSLIISRMLQTTCLAHFRHLRTLLCVLCRAGQAAATDSGEHEGAACLWGR